VIAAGSRLPGREMRKEFVLILVLFLTSSGSLLAQEEKTGYELGVFAAWQTWKSSTFQIGPPQSSTPIKFDFRYRDRIAYGVRGNFLSHGHWAGELSYSYQKNPVTITNVSSPSIPPTTFGGSVHQIFYNEVFYPAQYRHWVTPFITGGIGVAGYQLSESARESVAPQSGFGNLKKLDTRVALNYGAGLKVNIDSHVGFRADFRQIFSDVPSYGLPKASSNPNQVVLPTHGKLQTFEYSFGIFVRHLSEGFK
jgi:opacity protein-like surface antigen